jgi:hypothetical protein
MRPHPRISPPRPLTIAVLLLALVGLGAACGGDDDSAAPAEKTSDERPEETTTTEDDGGGSTGIASGILSSSPSSAFDTSSVASDEEECLGDFVIDALGEDEALEMSEADISTYTTAQMEALQAGFNECISGASVAGDLLSSFYEGAGATASPSPGVEECVADTLDGQTGDVVVESIQMAESDTLPPVMLATFDACVPPSDVALILEAAFSSSGLTPEQSTCMASALSGSITITQLAELGASDAGLPPDLEATITQAAQGCGA